MKNKINEWVNRYLPAEIFSLVLTLVSVELAFYFTQNKITTALIAMLVGNIVYFVSILLSDIKLARKECLNNKQKYTLIIFF